jgi:uncharacterized LabA/DUF88 family protein
MKNKQNNIAYIDAANLYRGVQTDGWELDYQRFRVWLVEKHGVQKAYLFIGLITKYRDLYVTLQQAGYILVFKETVVGDNAVPKGNCDADLVLRAVRDVYETGYDKAVLISSDGDFASTVQFLKEKGKMGIILSPHRSCSILLKRTNAPITYLAGVDPTHFRK